MSLGLDVDYRPNNGPCCTISSESSDEDKICCKRFVYSLLTLIEGGTSMGLIGAYNMSDECEKSPWVVSGFLAMPLSIFNKAAINMGRDGAPYALFGETIILTINVGLSILGMNCNHEFFSSGMGIIAGVVNLATSLQIIRLVRMIFKFNCCPNQGDRYNRI